MNLSRHFKPDIVCHGCHLTKAAKARSESSGGIVNTASRANRRRSSTSSAPAASCRPGVKFSSSGSGKSATTKPAATNQNPECESFGRSSDPSFRDTACKPPTNGGPTHDTTQTMTDCKDLASLTDTGPKMFLDDNTNQLPTFSPSFTEFHHRATSERIFEMTPYTIRLEEEADGLADPHGGGEGKAGDGIGNDEEDDGYEDEEDGSPPAMRYVHIKPPDPATLRAGQRAKEVKRAQHRATMEAMARGVAPAQLQGHLKVKGYLDYNYNVHARTTMSKANLKAGKKKGIERLMQLLTFV